MNYSIHFDDADEVSLDETWILNEGMKNKNHEEFREFEL